MFGLRKKKTETRERITNRYPDLEDELVDYVEYVQTLKDEMDRDKYAYSHQKNVYYRTIQTNDQKYEDLDRLIELTVRGYKETKNHTFALDYNDCITDFFVASTLFYERFDQFGNSTNIADVIFAGRKNELADAARNIAVELANNKNYKFKNSFEIFETGFQVMALYLMTEINGCQVPNITPVHVFNVGSNKVIRGKMSAAPIIGNEILGDGLPHDRFSAKSEAYLDSRFRNWREPAEKMRSIIIDDLIKTKKLQKPGLYRNVLTKSYDKERNFEKTFVPTGTCTDPYMTKYYRTPANIYDYERIRSR